MDRDFIYRQILVWLEHEGPRHALDCEEYRRRQASSLTNHLWNNWQMVERAKERNLSESCYIDGGNNS